MTAKIAQIILKQILLSFVLLRNHFPYSRGATLIKTYAVSRLVDSITYLE